MIKIKTQDKTKFILKATSDKKNKDIIATKFAITEFVSKKEAVLYTNKGLKKEDLDTLGQTLANAKREYQVDIKSFITKEVTEEMLVGALVEAYHFKNGKIYNVKTDKKAKETNLYLVNVSTNGKKAFAKAEVLAEAITYTRDLQVSPPNVLNSETYAKRVQTEFKKHTNISVKVLNKKQITDLKMGLLLSVNLGSAYEPRVVVLEYKGDSKSKEKTAIIGKGVTFDAGGYNIKTGKNMSHMKFDMSGSASVVGAMKAISALKPKSNVTGVLVLTDNMINPIASTPDAVFTAMNGKTVEINNTDAEGRLAMADGLTYAATKLGATRLIDIATLTGAALVALGHTYTGIWSTTDKAWKDVDQAAERANELVWRMPLHKDFIKYMKGSKVADLFNTDLSGMAGASSAAMFLTNFIEGKEYIHMDIAGTADVNGTAMGAMVKTLYEMANK